MPLDFDRTGSRPRLAPPRRDRHADDVIRTVAEPGTPTRPWAGHEAGGPFDAT